MNAYEILRDACATLSDRGNTPMMRAKGDRALAALAELERAAGEPVATVCLITDRFAHNHCIEAQLQVDQTTQLSIGTKLYTTPPPAKPAMGMFTADEMEAAYRRGRTDRKFPLDANDAWLTSATRQLVMERTS